MFLHTAKNPLPFTFCSFQLIKEEFFPLFSYSWVSMCAWIVSPLFSFRISPHLSFYSVASLFPPSTDSFYLQIFQGFQESAFSSSDPFVLPLTNILFRKASAHLTSSTTLWEVYPLASWLCILRQRAYWNSCFKYHCHFLNCQSSFPYLLSLALCLFDMFIWEKITHLFLFTCYCFNNLLWEDICYDSGSFFLFPWSRYFSSSGLSTPQQSHSCLHHWQ